MITQHLYSTTHRRLVCCNLKTQTNLVLIKEINIKDSEISFTISLLFIFFHSTFTSHSQCTSISIFSSYFSQPFLYFLSSLFTSFSTISLYCFAILSLYIFLLHFFLCFSVHSRSISTPISSSTSSLLVFSPHTRQTFSLNFFTLILYAFCSTYSSFCSLFLHSIVPLDRITQICRSFHLFTFYFTL